MRPTNHLGLPDRVLPKPLSRNLAPSYDVRPERRQCSKAILMPVHHYSGLDRSRIGDMRGYDRVARLDRLEDG